MMIQSGGSIRVEIEGVGAVFVSSRKDKTDLIQSARKAGLRAAGKRNVSRRVPSWRAAQQAPSECIITRY